ncbi:MAG: hypothetical protein ABH858_02720, partial [Candidatus Omnitrophota bacterium]
DPWTQEAKSRLISLGKVPHLYKRRIAEQAAVLSKEFTLKREQQRLRLIKEAQVHFNLAISVLEKGDFPGALIELKEALSLNPPDEELLMQIANLYGKVRKIYGKQQKKQQAATHIEDALTQLEDDNYFSAITSLKEAISVVSSFSR